ncbi:VWA domain-containing protein [Chondromyces apiculatus]|uniref:Basic proline-rich protein n=1 Tax=Chondromyces apiculatus DSM 436 TaxID=1192034 RepID=A0A017T931_9BACT|nr:VWA domain-containing protein [Chondromyces apiculatus]EYF05086.1 Basic proline-rich protein precursor [Chondromyces apiculatus DSM 436]
MIRLSSLLLCAASLLSLASTGCAARARASARALIPAPAIGVQVQGTGNVGAWGQGQASGYGSGTVGRTPAPPPPPVINVGPPPVFYGIPLAGAQDVVFVFDQSGSMVDMTTSAPVTNPLAGLALLGARAASFTLPASPTAFLSAAPTLFQAQDSKLEAAKAELISTISLLPDGTRFNIVSFDDTMTHLSPGLTTMNAITRVSTLSFIHGLKPRGSTAAVPALRTAYVMQPRRVVFLSDGLANVGGDRDALLAEARNEMRYGVRFDTVGVGPDQDHALMQTLARESGGISTSR